MVLTQRTQGFAKRRGDLLQVRSTEAATSFFRPSGDSDAVETRPLVGEGPGMPHAKIAKNAKSEAEWISEDQR